MFYSKNIVIAIVVPTFLVGCTSYLNSRQVGVGDYIVLPNSKEVGVGVNYALPMLIVDFKINRILTQCQDESNSPNIKFETKLILEPKYISGDLYTINYTNLSKWSKTSRFELNKYDSGILKSINIEANDSSKEIIGEVVKTGVGILSLVNGVPLGQLTNGNNSPEPLVEDNRYECSKNTINILNGVSKVENLLKINNSKLKEMENEKIFLLQVLAMGDFPDNDKKRLDFLNKEIVKIRKVIADNNIVIDKLKSQISLTYSQIGPSKSSEIYFDLSPKSLDRNKILSLFEISERKQGYFIKQLDNSLSLKAGFEFVNDYNLDGLRKENNCENKDNKYFCGNKGNLEKYDGIFYRVPVDVRVLLCENDIGFKNINEEKCEFGKGYKVTVSEIYKAPQFGVLNILPFKNGIFQKNSIGISFLEDGTLANISYEDKASRSKDLSNSISSGVDQIVNYNDLLKKSEINDLEYKLKKIDQMKKIDNALDSTSNDIDAANLKTSYINSQISLIEAKIKLKELESKKNID